MGDPSRPLAVSKESIDHYRSCLISCSLGLRRNRFHLDWLGRDADGDRIRLNVLGRHAHRSQQSMFVHANAAHYRCVIGNAGAWANLRLPVGHDHSVIQVVIMGINVGVIGNRAVFMNDDFASIVQQHVLVDRAVIFDGQVVAVRNFNAVKDLYVFSDVLEHVLWQSWRARGSPASD